MSEGTRNPDAFDPDQTPDLAADPDYLAWGARQEGERAFEDGCDLLAALNSRAACGASRDEINAFGEGYSRAMLRSIAVSNLPPQAIGKVTP